MTEDLHRKIEAVDKKLDIVLDTLNDLQSAFPEVNGKTDYIGHRNAHEAMAKAAEAQEKFWQEMRIDIAKKGAWGILLIVVGLVITGIQIKLGKWLV